MSKQEDPDNRKSIDQLFRKSYGKIVSLLIGRYGVSNIELIENATMEAYYKALKTWPYADQPSNPQGWLYRSAQNAYIDEIRKRHRMSASSNEDILSESYVDPGVFDEDEVKDPELKLLFLICHPQLKKEDQLAFMLKTFAGLGNKEISSALMIGESTIKKRLFRTRQFIKEQKLSFDWPKESEIDHRQEMVHTTLYLLFNEGFYSTHAEHWIRKDLCLEAMRLCKYLAEHKLANSDTYALLALMCYHISRYESRLDESGNIILLDAQDRSKWDPYFIKIGHHYLQRSNELNPDKSKFQIEAFISAQHCIADSIDQTNWKLLKSLYKALYTKEKHDLVLLNLVIVHLHLDEIDDAKRIFDSMSADTFKSNKAIYYMVGVELYSKLKDMYHIELLLERAIHASNTEREADYLKKKLKNIKNK